MSQETQADAPTKEEPHDIVGFATEATEETAQKPEETKPNGKDLEADAESDTNELNGQAGTESPGQDEDKDEEPAKKEVKQRARDRIQQLVAQKRQAEAEADSYKKQVAKLQKQLEAPGDDATQDEIDRFNLKSALREEKLADVEQEASDRVASAFNVRQQMFEAKADAAADLMPDLLDKFYAVPCSNEAADFIAESDKTAELANYLGSNPNEAKRINRLSAIRQVTELARLEGRLSAAPRAKRATQAPAPPKVLKGGSTAASSKTLEQMSEAEYIAYRSKKDKG